MPQLCWMAFNPLCDRLEGLEKVPSDPVTSDGLAIQGSHLALLCNLIVERLLFLREGFPAGLVLSPDQRGLRVVSLGNPDASVGIGDQLVYLTRK